MEKKWTIHQLERKSDDGFVVKVHWRYSITDTDELGKKYYADTYVVISYDVSKDVIIIPYDELTEEIVLGWLENSLDVELLDKKVVDQIENQKTPPILLGIPWGSSDNEILDNEFVDPIENQKTPSIEYVDETDNETEEIE
jgi:hypothetical protein